MRVLQDDLARAKRTIAELRARIDAQQSGQRRSEHPPSEDLPAKQDLQKQIELAHQEWMCALDAIDDPVFIHDRNFLLVRANRAYQRRAGIPFKEIIGRPYFEIFPKSDSPMPRCLHALESGQDDVDEEVLLDGRTYRSRAFPVSEESGEYLYSVHVL
jgi:PAS domain-containing protein